MPGQIAIFEGYSMPKRRKRRFAGHRGGPQQSRFTKAAKLCSRIVKKRGGSFKACMREKLKKGRR